MINDRESVGDDNNFKCYVPQHIKRFKKFNRVSVISLSRVPCRGASHMTKVILIIVYCQYQSIYIKCKTRGDGYLYHVDIVDRKM